MHRSPPRNFEIAVLAAGIAGGCTNADDLQEPPSTAGTTAVSSSSGSNTDTTLGGGSEDGPVATGAPNDGTAAESDPSSTTAAGPCGNGVAEGAEACDGDDLAGEDCISQGFVGGELACVPSCNLFDISGCIPATCGDGLVEAGESCDGNELDGEDCSSQGFKGGTLACEEGCNAFDTTSCLRTDCGNNLVENMEACDGTDLDGKDCSSQGFDNGTLTCDADCGGFETAQCAFLDCCGQQVAPGCSDPSCEAHVCAVDPFCCNMEWDEFCAHEANGLCGACEGGAGDCCNDETTGGCNNGPCVVAICGAADLDTTCCNETWDDTCVLLAEANCAICTPTASCGNDIVDEQWEACDGADLDGKDCVSLGFAMGMLACQPDCTALDSSGCI